MANLKVRLERALEKSAVGRHDLVCPVCHKEVIIMGDAAVEFLVADWVQGSGATDHAPPEDMAALLAHEHDPEDFLDKKSGLPFLSPEVSGMELSAGRGD